MIRPTPPCIPCNAVLASFLKSIFFSFYQLTQSTNCIKLFAHVETAVAGWLRIELSSPYARPVCIPLYHCVGIKNNVLPPIHVVRGDREGGALCSESPPVPILLLSCQIRERRGREDAASPIPNGEAERVLHPQSLMVRPRGYGLPNP